MNYKLNRFVCPTHNFQPILTMSKEPATTGGLLYCFVCQASLPRSLRNHLISIEDFLIEFFTDVSKTEQVKFHSKPSKSIDVTLMRLERLADLFTANAMTEKNTALHRLNILQTDFLDLVKRVRSSLIEEFNSKINFITQRLDTFKQTLHRHFDVDVMEKSKLTLERLFEEVNGCVSLNSLKQTLIRRLCDCSEIRENLLSFPSPDTVEEYLSALAEDIEKMALVFPKFILCDDQYFKAMHASTMKEFALRLGNGLNDDACKDLKSIGEAWTSELVSKIQFEKVKDQIWNDKQMDFYLIKGVEKGGKDFEEILRMFEVLENGLMVLKDSKERLIFCFKRGRSLRFGHKNITIMLLKSGECLKLEAEETPLDHGKKVHLTKDVSVIPKDRVMNAVEEDMKINQVNMGMLERAVCFGMQKIDPTNQEKMLIMDAELFGGSVR